MTPPKQGAAVAARVVPRQVSDLLQDLERELARGWGNEFVPTPTGFDPLDRYIGGGLRAGEMMLVGGVPGAGKTILTLQWARMIARAGARSIYCCYEHDESALLTRLMAMELGELVGHGDDDAIRDLRDRLGAVAMGEMPLQEALASAGAIREAYDRVQEYADRLWLVRCSGARTGLKELEEIVESRKDGTTVLFVDYLQKIAGNHDLSEADRITRATEGLKDLALSRSVPVVSVVAGDREGIAAKRLRIHHLRGSAALAYESDIVMLLNDKFRSVAKVHLEYDDIKARSFKDYVVFSIEKNRGGPTDINLEFRKDFAYFRFDAKGAVCAERLASDAPGSE